MAEELNVKAIEDVETLSDLMSWTVVPNFRALGPRLGPRVNEVKAALAEADGSEIRRRLEADGFVEVAGERLEAGDVEVRANRHEDFALAPDDDWAVAIDLELDEALELEGLARQLARDLNDLRRARGLSLSDRIEVVVRGRLTAPRVSRLATSGGGRRSWPPTASGSRARSWPVLSGGPAPARRASDGRCPLTSGSSPSTTVRRTNRSMPSVPFRGQFGSDHDAFGDSSGAEQSSWRRSSLSLGSDERAAAGLLGDGAHPAGGDGRDPDDFRPGEPSAQPAGGGHDAGLPPGVVDGLAQVLLAVELEEHPDVGPRLVEEPRADPELAHGLAQAGDGAGQLDGERLQQAAGGRRARWAAVERPPDADRARDAGPARPGQRVLQVGHHHQVFAQRRLQGLFPDRIVDAGGEVDQRLETVGAAEAVDVEDPVAGQRPTTDGVGRRGRRRRARAASPPSRRWPPRRWRRRRPAPVRTHSAPRDPRPTRPAAPVATDPGLAPAQGAHREPVCHRVRRGEHPSHAT